MDNSFVIYAVYKDGREKTSFLVGSAETGDEMTAEREARRAAEAIGGTWEREEYFDA